MKIDNELFLLLKRKIELQPWSDEALAEMVSDISYAELDEALTERMKIKEEDLN